MFEKLHFVWEINLGTMLHLAILLWALRYSTKRIETKIEKVRKTAKLVGSPPTRVIK